MEKLGLDGGWQQEMDAPKNYLPISIKKDIPLSAMKAK
jgi:hypothetical protein